MFASITAQSTKVATDWARAAEHAGVVRLMLLPPFVANPGEAGVREHVESVGSAGRWMVDAFDRGAVGVIPGGGLHEHYLEIYDHLSSDEMELATERHGELVPLLNHIGQPMEMFIHYEKRMLADRGLIKYPHCRAPSFSPDQYYDRVFERLYEPLRDRYAADAGN